MSSIKEIMDSEWTSLIKKIFELRKNMHLQKKNSSIYIDKLRLLCKSIQNMKLDIDEIIINTNEKNSKYKQQIKEEKKIDTMIKACLPFLTVMNIMI